MYTKYIKKSTKYQQKELKQNILSKISSGYSLFAAEETLGKWNGLSRSQVQRIILRMEREGLLYIDRRMMSSNIYFLGPVLYTIEGLLKYAKEYRFLDRCILWLRSSKNIVFKHILDKKRALLYKNNIRLLDIRKLRELAGQFCNPYVLLVYLETLKRLKPRGWWGNALPPLRPTGRRVVNQTHFTCYTGDEGYHQNQLSHKEFYEAI